MLHIGQQVEPIILAMINITQESKFSSPRDGVLVELADGTVSGLGEEGWLYINADGCCEGSDGKEENNLMYHINMNNMNKYLDVTVDGLVIILND